MARLTVETEKAPAAVGPYSQAVKAGNLLFVSGQLPLGPDGRCIEGEDAAAQTRRAIENLGAILHSQGLSFDDVVKTTLYVRDMNDFDEVNRAYADYFQSGPPARACVEVSRLPRGAAIEIEAIAAF